MANYKYEEVIKIANYFVKQKSVNDCAAACLTMIFKTYGLDVELDEVKSEMIMDSNGASAYEIVRISKKHGLKATGYKGFELDKARCFPFIAHTVNNKLQHFVVVLKTTLDNVYLLDPAKGRVKLSKDEFKKIFTGVVITFKNDMFSFKKIYKNKKTIVLITAIILFISLLNISYSYIVSFVVNNFNNKLIFSFLFLLLVVGLLREVVNFIKNQLLLNLQVKTDLRITLPTIRKIFMLPQGVYSKLSLGNLVTKLNDLSYVKQMVNYVSEVLLVNLVIIFIFLLSLLLVDVKLFFINILVFLIIFLLSKAFYKRYHYKTYELQVQNEALQALLSDALNGITTIKNLKKEYYFNKKIKASYKSLINNYNTTSFLYLKKDFIIKIIFTFLYICFFLMLIKSNTSNVNFFFTIYVEIMLLEMVSSLYNVFPLYSNYRSARLRLGEIDETNAISTGISISYINDITIKNLSYKYDDKPVLKNVRLVINKGEYLLVSGPTGSGKTTLFKLLTKQLSIGDGMIYINGIEINDINDNSITKNITYVDQKARLFNNTIKENIYLGNKNSLKENVKQVLDEVLKENNLGYDYVVDNMSSNLSSGQKALIIIAQSLLSQSSIIIFDETTSNLDDKTERKIISAIKKDYKEKTIVVISHRKSNEDMFDKHVDLTVLTENN